MHEARSKDELYRKIYHEPEGNIGVLRVKLMHSLLSFFYIFEMNLDDILSGKYTMEEYFKELEDRTGIIIKCKEE